MPSGQLVLQPPPQIQPNEGAAGVMMNAIPMLGSLGSIVLVATMARPGGGGGGRSFIAAGMFLFATLGFIVVQIDRQRKQRAQQVTGSRTEYLRYLGNVRRVARDAADQQRRALTWHHPDPASLPALAEERSRVWEHSATDPHFLHVRYGLCAQPLALDLVPPESAPIDEVDPAAASALHRLLVVHRAAARPAGVHRPAGLRPDRGLRRRGAGPRARPGDDLLGDRLPVPRQPDRRGALLRRPPGPLGLGQVAAPRPEPGAVRRGRADADGDHLAGRPRRRCCRPTSATGRASVPTSGRRRRTSCWSPTGSSCRPATTSYPPTGCTASPCSTCRPAGRSSRTPPGCASSCSTSRCRRARPGAGARAPAARGADPRQGRPVRPGHGRGVRAPAHPAAHRRRGRRRGHRGRRDHRPERLHGPARARRRPHLRPHRRLAPPAGARPAAGADRARRGRRRWSTSTSRSPPSRAWARTGW